MKTEWSKERLGYQPKQFEKVNETTYIQRKNIHRDVLTNDSIASEPGWVCECRFISDDIYEEFMEAMDSPSQQQIINNLHTITSFQELSDSNTLILMSAIADLYETIAVLSGL